MTRMPFTKITFFPSVLRGLPKSRLKTIHIQIATGKDEEERLNAISQMVYGKACWRLIFLYAEEEDPLVKLVADEQFPSSFSENLLHPLSLLLIMTMYKQAFDATGISSKRIPNNCYRGYKRLFVTQDRHNGYESALKQHQLPIDIATPLQPISRRSIRLNSCSITILNWRYHHNDSL